MIDRSHLDALRQGLAREKGRLAEAQSEGERALRGVWVAQAEREIAAELAFLGIDDDAPMTDDELLAELLG
jgi:hypothetical protein